MRRLLTIAKEKLAYALARGRRAVGAALGATTGQVVVRVADEWFDLTIDPAIATVIAIGASALGAWLTKENAPKRARNRG